MTSPFESINIVDAAVEQLIADAKRLGLVWSLVQATVAPVTGTPGVWPIHNTYVIQDNDTNVTRAISLIGNIAGGTRVMIMHVPPQGNYIIGATSSFTPGVQYVAWSSTSSPSIGASPTALFTITGVSYQPLRAYRVSFGQMISSSLSNTYADFRLHKQGGTQLGEYGRYTTVALGTNYHASGALYVSNPTSVTVSNQTVELRVSASIGTITQFASSDTARFLIVEDCGPAASFPFATSVLV